MKNKNFLIVGLIVVIAIISILFYCSRPEKQDQKSAVEKETVHFTTLLAKEEFLPLELKLPGTIVPKETRTLTFAISGKLEQGDKKLSVGSQFKFNQLLYKVNMQQTFELLTGKKKELKTSIVSILPELTTNFPAEQNKWNMFVQQLDPAKRLPDFPIINSTEERNLIKSTTIAKDYIKALKLENEIEKYFYLAPFDGVVMNVYKKPGTTITAGMPIAKIAKNNAFNVHVEVSSKQIKTVPKEVQFYNAEGNLVGKGVLIKRVDKSGDKQFLTFSFNSVKGVSPEFGDHLEIHLSESISCFKLPKSAVNDKKVLVMGNSGIVEREVTIIDEKADSIYLTGLKSGEEIILN